MVSDSPVLVRHLGMNYLFLVWTAKSLTALFVLVKSEAAKILQTLQGDSDELINENHFLCRINVSVLNKGRAFSIPFELATVSSLRAALYQGTYLLSVKILIITFSLPLLL